MRKWLLPGMSNMLFAIRAPVALAAYILALRAGVFPWNKFVGTLTLLGGLSFFVGLIPDYNTLFVSLVGVHSNFFHLPFLFLMAKVMDSENIRKIGWFFLMLGIPMAILMIIQFEAGPFSYINMGAGGEEGQQLGSAMGRIRPSGLFAFSTGPAWFYSVVTAFLLYGFFTPKAFPWWLMLSSATALVAALAVSGSRTLVAAVAIITTCTLIGCCWHPRMLLKFARLVVVLGILGWAASYVPVVGDGFEVLFERFYLASISEGGSGGTAKRIFMSFTPDELFFDAPMLGYGLGTGTSAGMRMLTERGIDLMRVEGEWDRNMMEGGPILGSLYIIWRICLVTYLGWNALLCAIKGHMMALPLWAACSLLLLLGQFGPATNLGFAVMIGGLTCAALREREVSEAVSADEDENAEEAEEPGQNPDRKILPQT